MKKNVNWISAATFIFTGFALLLGCMQDSALAWSSNDAVLSKSDCIKCHDYVIDQLKESGGRHASKVECLDCHAGTHPPKTMKGAMIPQCSKCHNDPTVPHFSLEGCLLCHHNPHQPLNIVFDGSATGHKAACQTCHPDIVEELAAHPTSHTGFACSMCHDRHRFKPDCLQCHDPHMEGQKFENCVQCHQAHQPLTLAYDKTVTNDECGACHSDVRATLEGGASKHAKFRCVFCHANKHAFVPDCRQCHASPHSENMLKSFATCNECHQSAHDILR